MRLYSPQETKLSASRLAAEDKVYFRALQPFTHPASSGGDSMTETVHRQRNPVRLNRTGQKCLLLGKRAFLGRGNTFWPAQACTCYLEAAGEYREEPVVVPACRANSSRMPL